MYVRKWQCYHYLVITFLIKTKTSVFIFVVINILIGLKFSITSSFTLIFLLDDLGVSTGSIVVRMFGFDYYVSNIYCLLFYQCFDSEFLIKIMKFDIFFKYILRKRNSSTLTPSYLGNVSF